MDIKRKQTKKKNMGLLLAGVGLSLGVCSGALFDGVELYHKHKSDGLVLLKDGAHLKQGMHKVVISDQFYELLTFKTKEVSQKLVINGIKTAYDRLNEVNTGIQFELCTTVPKIAQDYSIKQVENFDLKNDILLYMTDKYIDDRKDVLAKVDCKTDFFTRERTNGSIIFKKDSIFSVWKYYDDSKQTLAPQNTCVYTLTLHETLHYMGFAHQDDKNSIMYPHASYENTDLNSEMIEMIQKYNYVNYETNQIIQNQSNTEQTDGLTF